MLNPLLVILNPSHVILSPSRVILSGAKDLNSTLRVNSVKDLTFLLKDGFAKIQMLRCAQHDRKG